MYKHLTVIFLSVLFISSSAFAKDQVVIIKKRCDYFSAAKSMVCEGIVKNIGDTDVKNVVIKFTPSLPKGELAEIISNAQEIAEKLVDKVDKNDSTLTVLEKSDLEKLPVAADSSIEYLPSKETTSFEVKWKLHLSIDKLDVIKAFVAKDGITRSIQLGTKQIDISYAQVK